MIRFEGIEALARHDEKYDETIVLNFESYACFICWFLAEWSRKGQRWKINRCEGHATPTGQDNSLNWDRGDPRKVESPHRRTLGEVTYAHVKNYGLSISLKSSLKTKYWESQKGHYTVISSYTKIELTQDYCLHRSALEFGKETRMKYLYKTSDNGYAYACAPHFIWLKWTHC